MLWRRESLCPLLGIWAWLIGCQCTNWVTVPVLFRLGLFLTGYGTKIFSVGIFLCSVSLLQKLQNLVTKIANGALQPFSQGYSPRWALASTATSLHCPLSCVFSIHCFIFITFKSAFQIRLPNFFCQHLFLILPRLIVGFRNKLFLRCRVVSPTPNLQPGGPWYPFSSGSSPLTCLAWKALPVAYAMASIALGFIWPRKPLHYVKVGIFSGGKWCIMCVIKWDINPYPTTFPYGNSMVLHFYQ